MSNQLSRLQLYRINYSMMMCEIFEYVENGDIQTLEEFDKKFDKLSRKSNISSVKMFKNPNHLKALNETIEDFKSANMIYNKKEVTVEVEELRSNKYCIRLILNDGTEIENKTIYAPNYKTAVDRANILFMYLICESK